MTDLLDRSDLDTWLSLSLLREGRLSQAVALDLLQSARADRAEGGPSLARTLIVRGLFTQPELESFLEGNPGAPVLPSAKATSRLRRLGPYDLERELGAGGMGKVYLARHRETGAKCAIKTLTSVDPEGLARFEREGQGQARVDEHPNVVKVHALAQERGTHYLVMDLIEGGSLEDRLRRGAPDRREAAGWVRDLAGAIEFAHERGVLHRDIKPANVLFDGDRPLLVDFGLVKLADARSLTETGTVLGTPGYMAPEQVDGRRGLIGPATDVYGLGALLYRCLTGRAPFAAATVWLSMLQVLEQPPLRPRELCPDLEPALEAVCLRCLEKDPANRYPSAASLIAAIDLALGAAGESPSSLLSAKGTLLVVTLLAVFAAVVGFPTWDRPVPKLAAPTTVPSSTPPVSPSPSVSGQPPPLIVPSQLQASSGPHSYDRAIVNRLRRGHRRGQTAQALCRVRRLLSAPLNRDTPRMHRIAARLMLEINDSQQMVRQSRQAIVYAALHGDAHAALILANHHLSLSQRLRQEEFLFGPWSGYRSYVREDPPLVAAALGLARHWQRGQAHRPTEASFNKLKKKVGRRIPLGQAAHDIVWRSCPEGRDPLPPVEPPSQREAVWSSRTPESIKLTIDEYMKAREQGQAVSPEQLAEGFSRSLLPGGASGMIFRELGRAEPPGGARRLDFLARAAVAGDGRAAILLARVFGANVKEIDNLDWSLTRREPDDELAGACIVLAMTAREDAMKMIATGLRAPPTAEDIKSAYRVLWDRFPGAR